MSDSNQFLETRMNERIAHQVKTNLLGQRPDLVDDASKQFDRHQAFFALHFGAKTALKVADIADLDIDFFKALGSHLLTIPLHAIKVFS
jgi:hypothetical protein